MKKRIIQIALYIMLCVVFLLAMAGTVMADEPELDSNPTNAVDINTQGELLAVLNDTGTKTGTYRLQSDLTIDTSTLRQKPIQNTASRVHWMEMGRPLRLQRQRAGLRRFLTRCGVLSITSTLCSRAM